jgi:hypothetical protein
MAMTTSLQELKLKTDEELAEWMAGWKEHTGNYILAEIEFKRRLNKNNEVRGWIAIVLSVLAISISIIALINHITA